MKPIGKFASFDAFSRIYRLINDMPSTLSRYNNTVRVLLQPVGAFCNFRFLSYELVGGVAILLFDGGEPHVNF